MSHSYFPIAHIAQVHSLIKKALTGNNSNHYLKFLQGFFKYSGGLLTDNDVILIIGAVKSVETGRSRRSLLCLLQLLEQTSSKAPGAKIPKAAG